ncbi:succinate dehydrogenase iron-sulfur subunit [Candidatus Sumerlaeota bacterium]|nr:succinate dehydrogenase iron-sulfur subunit [Candidatus Sumerlaeota bacterium]
MAKDTKNLVGKPITFKILRYDPDKDTKPYYKTYQITLERGMTVLDGLMHIKENQDSTLAYRKSCRMGICGSCAMYINGLPRLACQTQISELNSPVVVVAPLPNYPILRDVVPDLDPLFIKHQNIKPYIIREDKAELEKPTGEFSQTPEELERYIQFSYCIKCGACLAACPTVSTSDLFIGPQAGAQAYRYIADTRDDGFNERLQVLDDKYGVWRCHFPGACSEACPKGVDPAFAIQLLKREIVARRFGFKSAPKPAPLAPKPEKAERRPGIPEAPAPTVGQ